MSIPASITISLPEQKLVLNEAGRETSFAISSASKGAGQQAGSYQTPLGRHVIRAKIGQGVPCGAVFVGRRPTGEIYSPVSAA
jgi:L,D-transpeptidase YbiS